MKVISIITAVINAILGMNSPAKAAHESPPSEGHSPLPLRQKVLVQTSVTALPLTFADAAKLANTLPRLLGDVSDVTIRADEASNTLFIWANEEKTKLAREIVARADRKSHFFVLPLEHANAAKVLPTLSASLGDGGAVLLAEEKTNSIVISATAATIERLKQLLKQLDVAAR